MALVKHNNNSISAVTSMASLSTGSMVLISEQTASASASISFTSGIDSTYPIYKFEFINIHPATDNVGFTFQTSTNGGSSYGVTATTTFFLAYHKEDDSQAALTYDATHLAQSTSFQSIMNLGNDNDQCGSGTLYLYNPSSTTFVKHFMTRTNSYEDNDRSFDINCAGYFNTTSVIDAIQFKQSSGNIDSGTIKLYGIKDS